MLCDSHNLETCTAQTTFVNRAMFLLLFGAAEAK